LTTDIRVVLKYLLLHLDCFLLANVRFGSFADNTLSRESVHPQLNPGASSKNYIPNFEMRFDFHFLSMEKAGLFFAKLYRNCMVGKLGGLKRWMQN